MQFKSQNGTGCLVNIWEENHISNADTSKTGANVPFVVESGVIALKGTANPFTIQEDDDDSLVSVFRIKTGYIRAMETSYGQLTDLYPDTNTQHYVEMYYGSTLAFTGYMQAQSFENNWVPSPRGLTFPIMSPLGLADGIKLNAIATPQRVSLASLLHEAITGLNAAYTKVIIPDVAHSIEGVVNSFAVSPYNPEFSSSVYDYNPVFAPITYAELIEGICNAFGWIVHDTPDALVFTMFDHFGDYAQYTLANLPTMSDKTIVADGSAVVALGTISQVAGADGKESTILPYKEIKIQYEGGNGASLSFDFDKVRMYSESHVGSRHCAFLQSMDGRLQTQFPNYYNALDEQTSLVAYPGVMLADCGGDSEMRQCVLVNVDPNWDFVTAPAFSLLFPYPPTVPTILNYKAKFGMWVSGMTDSDEEFEYTHYFLTAYAKVGNKYLLMDGTWGTSGQKRWLYDGIKIPAPPSRDVLELEFWIGNAGATPQAKLLSVEDISLKEDEEMFGKYKDKHASSDTINGSSGSYEDASISMLFSYVKEGSNMIGDVTYPMPTSYPYLRKSQLRLKAPFKMTLPAHPYCPLIDYWLNNKRWRIIAMDFEPWDDIYTLILHRSPCLDENASSFSVSVTGHVSSDAPAYVQKGSYLQINIFPDDGYDIDYIDVYMGGVNISADAWPGYGNVISIEEVTGVVSITVHTVAEALPYDAEVEYIESDGSAYINSGVKITSATTFDFSLILVETDVDTWLYGGRATSTTGHIACRLEVASNNRYCWRYSNGNNAVSANIVWGENRMYNTNDPRSLVIVESNSTRTLTRSSATFSTETDFMIFALKTSPTATPPVGAACMKFKSGKMWQGGTLVRDFIAVRVGQVGYLYDKVSKTLFGNANESGAFIIGNDKTT